MITRIEAINMYCFTTFELDVPPDGTLIEGGNARGKTSVLNMIRAALVEKGATKDMIKKGSDKGEILVRVDGHLVKRVLHGGDKWRQTLRVTDDRGHVVPEPGTFLKNLLGLSPLDPIELFLEKDKGKRRAKILSAIPVTVTIEQLASWCPPNADLAALVGAGRGGVPDVSGHGLEVIERARKALYAQRTDANRVVKERQAAADQATAKQGAAHDAFTAWRVSQGMPVEAPGLDEAQRALDEAKREQYALVEQQRAAEQSARAQVRTREKIGKLRQQASDMRANQPIAPTSQDVAKAWLEVEKAAAHVSTAMAMVEDLKAKLAQAEAVLATMRLEREACKNAHRLLEEQQQRAEKAVDEIVSLEGQADELEQALGALPVAPSEGQIAGVEHRARRAANAVEHARKVAELLAHAEQVDQARRLLQGAQADANALDRSVKALADDAPTALLAAADGIKGLTIDGDDVFLDGVSLDQLSGQERLFFAVEVARRLNAKSKLLCVDGIEVLDAEHRRAFVNAATKDGFQLIATRVVDDGGDPIAKPIQASF